MTRILVTGSRDLTDVDLVHDALSDLWEHTDPADSPEFVVVHGGARGADRMAGDWVKLMRRYGVKEEVHHANWHEEGRAAGPSRNQRMVDSKPDVVLAFYRTSSLNIGTKDCVRRARLAHIPVFEYAQP